MKKILLIACIAILSDCAIAQNLTIKNYTNCSFNIILTCSDNNNPTCEYYRYIYNVPVCVTYVSYPANLTSTPSVITWSDPTAVNPWFHNITNYTLVPADNPTWSSVITAIAGMGCTPGDLYLSCGPGSSTYSSNSSCLVSSCSATGQVNASVTTPGGNYLITIQE